ncbi:hypothetical protein JOH51_007038 [Rhizobium leguminosarum]|nr:hypothetical protein [Rhizobium leguminosarum]
MPILKLDALEYIAGALVRGYEIERILLFDVVGYACLT